MLRNQSLLLLVAIAFAGCVGLPGQGQNATLNATAVPTLSTIGITPQEVNLVTRDGVSISGSLYSTPTSGPVVILLHMLGGNRTQWGGLPMRLAREGFTVLALDLRGHGASVNRRGEQYLWQSFNGDDFLSMTQDVEAAKNYMATIGKTGPFSIIGASIGANVALRYSAQDREAANIVALSPALDYRGVTIAPFIPELNYRELFVVVANGDEAAVDAYMPFAALSRAHDLIWKEGSKAHGTELLSAYPELEGQIVDWLKEKTAKPK